MSNKLTGVLVDVCNDVIEKCELDGTLQDFYRVLKCDCIDITCRKIAGREFDFVVDDEGLLKHPLRVSAVNSKREPMLVGNLFICASDEEGSSVSISDEDIDYIKEHTLGIISGFEFWSVIRDVDY